MYAKREKLVNKLNFKERNSLDDPALDDSARYWMTATKEETTGKNRLGAFHLLTDIKEK
jgi:hypothetical protein